jgi:succinyl-diaminopimelate desuccinylase
MIAACQELVRIPSLSGEEAAAGVAFAAQLRALAFDRVEIDDKGNVVGWLDGEDDGPTLLVNGHLDHVPPGDMADPYAGALVAAMRWGESGLAIAGRGTCDMKCNVVAAAFGLAAWRRSSEPASPGAARSRSMPMSAKRSIRPMASSTCSTEGCARTTV